MKLLGLTPVERDAGVVAVSGGNHGIAVAEVADGMGVRATAVMAKTAPPRSIHLIRAAGAELRLTEDMAGAFALLEELVADGMTLVHPFDDPTVLAGQGTVGLELAEDAPPLTDVLVSIGGGALISGVAVAIKALMPDVRIGAWRRRAPTRWPARSPPASRWTSRRPPSRARSARRTCHSYARPRPRAGRGGLRRARRRGRTRNGGLRRGGQDVGRTGDRLPRPGRGAGHRARPHRRFTGLRRVRRNVTQRDVRGWFDRLL